MDAGATASPSKTREALAAALKVLDKDATGVVTQDDVKQFLRESGDLLNASSEAAGRNEDGSINVNEFVAWLEKGERAEDVGVSSDDTKAADDVLQAAKVSANVAAKVAAKVAARPPCFSGNVGPLASVSDYVPKDDKSHFRLGIKLKGMGRVLERIGFLKRIGQESYREFLNWKVSERTSWLGTAPKSGYDVCTFTRHWLKTNGHTAHSLCEVVLLDDDNFTDLRENIGIADTFFSHRQREELVGSDTNNTFGGIYDAQNKRFKDRGKGRTWWLDYFGVRHGQQSDFEVYAVVELIYDIGAFVAFIDADLSYTERSFCVLEVYAATLGNTKCVAVSPLSHKKLANKLQTKPVDSEHATTRCKADKEQIDSFIMQHIDGRFEELDRIVTETLLAANPVEDAPSPRLKKSAEEASSPKLKK